MGRTELLEELLESGAFEGENPEFDPKEYTGLEKVAKRLHRQTTTISPVETSSIERLQVASSELALKERRKIVDELRNHPDKIWHMDAFEKDGKYNCLRVTRTGTVFLDIIKPGVHSRYTVKLAEHISPEGIAALRSELQKKTQTWENKLPYGFLAEGITEHNAQSTFDENGGTRPGAVFVADRVLDLGVINNAQRAVLHWVVEHTNADEEGGVVKVGDSFRFKWESLPQH